MPASHVVVIRAVGKQQLFPTTTHFLALPCWCMCVKVEQLHHKKDVFVLNWCQLCSLGRRARVTEPTFNCSRFAGGEADFHRCAVSGPNHTWWCLSTSKQAQWRFDNSAFVNWGCFDFWYWRVPIQEPETEALAWWSGTWHQSQVSACDVDP